MYLNITSLPFILTGIINGFKKHMNLRYHYDCELVQYYKQFYFHHSLILKNCIFYLRGWGVSLIISTQTKLVIYIYINLVAVFMLNLYHSKLRSADTKLQSILWLLIFNLLSNYSQIKCANNLIKVQNWFCDNIPKSV